MIGEEEHFTLIQSYNEHCGKFGLEPVAAKSTDMLVVDEQEVDHGLTISVDTLNVEYMKLQDSLTEEEMRSRRGKIAQESFHQYKEFEYLAAEKGLEGVLGNLLDRSAPITERYEAKKLEAIRPELEENFQLSAQAVKALRKRDLVPVQFSMKWQLNLERVSKPVTSLENAISEGEEIHVRFVLHKSDDIGREYLGGQIGKVPTVMDDGTLVVHLLAIGGSWYWRPFGW